MFASAAWACLAAALVQAQAPPDASPYAAVSGFVLNHATGEPIRRAMVTLSTLDNPPLEALTFTTSNGAFGFTSVPPGRYRLLVERDGFQPAWFGAGTPNRPPAVLKLAAGDVRSGMTFRLRPLGSISGVVLDADGDPLPGAEIRLLKATTTYGGRSKPAYAVAVRATSGQAGRYRLPDVLPGAYVIMAGQPATLLPPEFTAGQSNPAKVYGLQFYRDTERLPAAARVRLEAGKSLEDIDFHLAARFAASLRGRVQMPEDASDDARVEIVVAPQDVPPGAQEKTRTAGPPDYTFAVSLPPGPYLLGARLADAGQEYYAYERIELPAGGREINLRLDHGVEVNGRIEWEGDGARAAGPLHVWLTPRDALHHRALQAEVQADGTFALPAVPPGTWDAHVEPIPPGGYLRGAWLGQEDVLQAGMLLTPGNRAALRIAIDTRGGVATGKVTAPDAAARPVRAFVLLAPADGAPGALQYADDTGHFEFTGIRPGRYRIFAFEELDPLDAAEPGFLRPFEQHSEAFQVPEGGRISKDVPLIPANAAPAAEK